MAKSSGGAGRSSRDVVWVVKDARYLGRDSDIFAVGIKGPNAGKIIASRWYTSHNEMIKEAGRGMTWITM